ncbi:MAG: PIN domain-containing protein [Oscillospiraceae bacterium]|nr:PIN domain-containing protein [Oscillospiraceae bacterium]
MDVLIDTNIILDSIMKREPFLVNSKKIISLCLNGEINGCIAAHTITNLFFILRNEIPVAERKRTLLRLCSIFTVVSIDNDKITSALDNDKFDDFEDCLQDECASDFNADYIVTRNISDFKDSKIKAIEPSEFLSIFKGRCDN